MNKPPLRAVVAGSGHAAGSEVLDNDFFVSYLDTSDEWITSRSGIKERRRIAEGESSLTLARDASIQALADANMDASELDLIIVTTVTPETVVPSTACWLQRDLGVKDIPAYDMNAACAGFTYGMIQAGLFIETGVYKNVLVVGSETLTTLTDYQDRSTCVLFGDAAGAVILTRTEDEGRGICWYTLGAQGDGAEHIWVPAGGSKLPPSEMTVAERLHFIRMNGREVYKFAVLKFNRVLKQMFKETGLSAEDLKLIIPHQSNLRMIESMQQKLGLPMDRFAVNIDRYGNTSSASCGVAFDEVRREGRIEKNDLVLFIAFGAGLTWGATLYKM